eukprot:TRINITY_DN108871_c0_g1_i1.p1 TRINITY_DN108871_c0_g1~~TRINITY_DN108871_c0_g1_i1.p1  ORF type:complete len:147 (+),score=27.80 TRINITY_DN108871_c0_g1_i1:66-443(+)
MAARSSSKILVISCLALVVLALLRATEGAFGFVTAASRRPSFGTAQAGAATAAITTIGAAFPAFAEKGDIETQDGGDDMGMFVALSVVVTVSLIIVPGVFAMLQSGRGKFQADVPDDFLKSENLR